MLVSAVPNHADVMMNYMAPRSKSKVKENDVPKFFFFPSVQVPVLASGLDKIFVCTLADDAEALKRALGRRVDPTTRSMYHLEYSPPAEEDKM
jgi:hypothetical protein